jgi:hypothetical protein
MSRMVQALKSLEARQPAAVVKPAVVPPTMPAMPLQFSIPLPLPLPVIEADESAEAAWETAFKGLSALQTEVAASLNESRSIDEPNSAEASSIDEPLDDLGFEDLSPLELPPVSAKVEIQPASYEAVALPITRNLDVHYLDMAARINDQPAFNYSSVLLFVSLDRWVEPAFSMTHLAQGFAAQSSGDVLLVDGDLRFGRLSKTVCHPGPGMVEAMLGTSLWTDIIHPTNVARIDFVSSGLAQVPTLERPEFGWGALRPLYRSVLIGLAETSEPETLWLAARCDAVYFIISRPHSRRGVASAAVNDLRACGANVMGCIVAND